MKRRVVSQVRREILAPNRSFAPTNLSAATQASTSAVGAEELRSLTREVRADLYGAGELQQLLELPRVTDVLVNGPRDVWIDRGDGLEPTALDLGSESQVRALAVRLAATAGRRLDDAEPAVDARLRDGVRLHAVLPPLTPEGTVISLRVPTARPLRIAELVSQGMVTAKMSQILTEIIERRVSFLISGATGTGKTTLLGTLLSLIPPAQRMLVIEESQELNLDHPHVVHLQTRIPNVEGAGGVGLGELVRHALRMRPDRLILGECRGGEVQELLTAFNTGHEGGGATLHANTAADVPARLAALGALAGMDRFAIASQAASAIRVLIHLRQHDRQRWVSEIAVLARAGTAELQVIPAWRAPVPGTEIPQQGHQVLRKVLAEGRE